MAILKRYLLILFILILLLYRLCFQMNRVDINRLYYLKSPEINFLLDCFYDELLVVFFIRQIFLSGILCFVLVLCKKIIGYFSDARITESNIVLLLIVLYKNNF